MSRKSVPKRKAGIPLDELLAAQDGGDDRLETLMGRYRGSVVPASALGAKAANEPKPIKTAQKKAPGARLARPDGSKGRPDCRTAPGRLRASLHGRADDGVAARRAASRRVRADSRRSASGASRSRPGLSRALEDLGAGDTLGVWRLDRLGRSLRDLLDISEMLRERDVGLRSLTDHIDTGTAAGRMLYAVLGAVAQLERDVLRERTVAGMRAAKSRGEHIGRPSALSAVQIREAKKMLARGESPNHVARILRVGRSTLYRAIA